MDTTAVANLISLVLPAVTPYLDKHPREVVFAAIVLWLTEQIIPLFPGLKAKSATQLVFFGISRLIKSLIRKGNQP